LGLARSLCEESAVVSTGASASLSVGSVAPPPLTLPSIALPPAVGLPLLELVSLHASTQSESVASVTGATRTFMDALKAIRTMSDQ
jgi:hypothetical protein